MHNIGTADVTFGGGSTFGDSDVIIFSDPDFSVPRPILDSLKKLRFRPGFWFSIPVLFTPRIAGEHFAQAYIRQASPLDVDSVGLLAVVKTSSGVKDDPYMLMGNAFEDISPNPVSGRMVIDYHLGAPGQVNVAIYNAAGTRVALLVEGARSVGDQSVTWNASAQPSGIYFCRIESGQWNATQTFVVVR
jgi:hypothetical protein